MNKLKPSEVANLCAFRILPGIAFLAFSVYSFHHTFGPECSPSHDCIYNIVVAAWILIGMVGIFIGVVLVVSVVGCLLFDKWNDWLDKMDKKSGF